MQLPALQTPAVCRALKHLFACCLLLTGFALPLSAWAVDTDGDGVDDGVDAFPTYPEATTDTDGDGQPDVLNNIIFQDSFNGTVAAGWTGLVTSGQGWMFNSSTFLVAYGGDPFRTYSLSRSVLIPALGGTVSYLSKNAGHQVGTYTFNNISNSLFYGTSWRKSVYPLNAGVQTLTWSSRCSYATIGFGINCGFLDDVEIRFNSSLVEDLDDDNDGVLDATDQCPLDPGCSADADGDGIENAIDTDDDNDGALDVADNCPVNSNADQLNTDGDAQGNVCDTDDDNDGVTDTTDQCPLDPACSIDTDGDGIDNLVDADDDNDGALDVDDNCPLFASADQTNSDGDAQGNVCDTDDDNDGVADTSDKFPLNAAASSDADNDSFPGSWNAACDLVCQNNSGLVLDNCPSNANANQLNTDGDTQGNVCDTDDDNDGVLDTTDQCPLDPACTIDTDGDGIDNAIDTDDDNDTVLDGNDNCPLNANSNQADTDGDGLPDACTDTDDDNDGVADVSDKFPLSAAASSDYDMDGFPGGWHLACDLVCQSHSGLVLDNCPTVANANQLDTDGDGAGDVCDNASYDNDSDGVNNFVDNCPNNSNVDQLNADGDSQGNSCDTDDDNDGVPDASDACPLDATAAAGNNDNDTLCDLNDLDDDNDGDLDTDEIAQGSDPLDKNSNASAITIISFENGLPAGWTKPAAANVGWVSDATQASHLTKSLRTAATGNSQKAQVQMTAYFSGTSFSFDVKVSTESNNDNFRVYVDGTGQVTKSGELGWQTITVPITAGTHTIKFEYLKNGSIASGSDAVWIDKFSFSNGDVDNDGQANTVDLDDDNDGAPDYLDPEPLNPANSSVWPLNNHYQGSAMRESQAVQ